MRIDRTSDGTQAAPYLRRDINLGTVTALPRGSAGYRATLTEQFALIKSRGYAAVQSWDQASEVMAAGLRATGMARITEASQCDALARSHKDTGLDATTLHVGTGFEADAEMDAL